MNRMFCITCACTRATTWSNNCKKYFTIFLHRSSDLSQDLFKRAPEEQPADEEFHLIDLKDQVLRRTVSGSKPCTSRTCHDNGPCAEAHTCVRRHCPPWTLINQSRQAPIYHQYFVHQRQGWSHIAAVVTRGNRHHKSHNPEKLYSCNNPLMIIVTY